MGCMCMTIAEATRVASSADMPFRTANRRATSAPSISKQRLFLGSRVSPKSWNRAAVHRIGALKDHPSPAAIAAPQQYARTEWVRR